MKNLESTARLVCEVRWYRGAEFASERDERAENNWLTTLALVSRTELRTRLTRLTSLFVSLLLYLLTYIYLFTYLSINIYFLIFMLLLYVCVSTPVIYIDSSKLV